MSFSLSYATDETVCLACRQDWPEIVPDVLVEGSDGQVGEGPSRFDFTSESAGDWASLGIAPGMVLSVERPGDSSKSQDHYAVASVSGSTLALRRLGQPAGVGRGPTLPGSASGISYTIRSAAGAIAAATGQLRSRYGLDADEMPAAGWSPLGPDGLPSTADAWSRAAALMVACDLYLAAHAGTVLSGSGLTSGQGDAKQAKYREYLARLKDALAATDATLPVVTSGGGLAITTMPVLGLLGPARGDEFAAGC